VLAVARTDGRRSERTALRSPKFRSAGSQLYRRFAALALSGLSVVACQGGDADVAGQAGGGAASDGAVGAADGGAGQLGFARDVHPIFLAKCAGAGCHSTGNAYQPGHASADVAVAYAATQGVTGDGAPVYARILARTSGKDPRGSMPPPYATPPCQGAPGAPGCLTVAEFELIEAWVNSGMQP
jgi:hypothetical protein